MPRVFISHRTSNRAFVDTELIPLLHKFGIDTWYCKDDIFAGDAWERAIFEGFRSCDWFLVIMSPARWNRRPRGSTVKSTALSRSERVGSSRCSSKRSIAARSISAFLTCNMSITPAIRHWLGHNC